MKGDFIMFPQMWLNVMSGIATYLLSVFAVLQGNSMFPFF